MLLGVKTWQVPAAADALGPLLGADTFVVPLQNGVDTAEVLAAKIGAEHVVGGTCGGFCFIEAPGHIRHIGGTTFIKLGELHGASSARVERLRAAFERAGVAVDVPADIRVALWQKLMLVVPFGGIGAVTRAPIGVIRSVPQTRQLLERGMREIHDVARARGIGLSDDAVARSLATLDSVTASGTSSLQRDFGAGKRSELRRLDRRGGASRRRSRCRDAAPRLHLREPAAPRAARARRAQLRLGLHIVDSYVFAPFGRRTARTFPLGPPPQ